MNQPEPAAATNLASLAAAALARVLDWLRAGDPLPAQADVVIGFGHFDLRIPEPCTELVRTGVAPRLILTGGFGAGTGTLGGPEATAFQAAALRSWPELRADQVLVENQSTNTAENIQFTRRLADRRDAAWHFGRGIRRAVLVAHPARLRRVRQTWLKLVPDVHATAVAPAGTWEDDAALHAREGSALREQVLGEVERLENYRAQGWIEPIAIPAEVLDAVATLRRG